jgi:hypothetical protein
MKIESVFCIPTGKQLFKMVSKKRIAQYCAVAAFIVGAVLLGVGSAGAATPLIVAGVILVIASGAAGFMTAMEHPASGRPLFTSSATAAAPQAA